MPYSALREKLIEDASAKYRQGIGASPSRKPEIGHLREKLGIKNKIVGIAMIGDRLKHLPSIAAKPL